MRAWYAPGLIFAGGTIGCLLIGIWILSLSLSQPALGVTLVVKDANLIIAGVEEGSDLPLAAVSQRLISIAEIGKPPVGVNAITLIEEPDMIGGEDGPREFYLQQDQLFQVLASGRVSVAVSDGETQKTFVANT